MILTPDVVDGVAGLFASGKSSGLGSSGAPTTRAIALWFWFTTELDPRGTSSLLKSKRSSRTKNRSGTSPLGIEKTQPMLILVYLE